MAPSYFIHDIHPTYQHVVSKLVPLRLQWVWLEQRHVVALKQAVQHVLQAQEALRQYNSRGGQVWGGTAGRET